MKQLVRQWKYLMLLSILTPALAVAQAQEQRQPQRAAVPLNFDFNSFREDRTAVVDSPDLPEFVWARGRYTNYPGGGGMRRNGGWWDTDYPDAESNFLRGLQRYTNIDSRTTAYRWIDLTSPELFEHTFLYMNFKRVPIGTTYSGPNFNPEEIEALREFMFRGGFVMVDDFWGEEHWQDFQLEIAKLFPERDLVRLETDHEIFHTFYDIEQITQVPGRMVTWDYGYFNLDDPNYPPSVHAILDDDGRVMFVANLNTDLGDGWEHTFLEEYPTRYINEAYKLTINYLIYAYTH